MWVPNKNDSLREKSILSRADTAINISLELIHSGDLVTRTGNDFTSQSLRSLNQRDKTYSHIGIASLENDSVFIYHALGGEWNPDEKIRREYYPFFADPVNNNGVGIYRLNLSEKNGKDIARQAIHFYEAGIPFDMKFDLQTDDKMYCAEFVYKAIQQSLPVTLPFRLSHINHFIFVGVDDLILLPGTNCIRKIKFRDG